MKANEFVKKFGWGAAKNALLKALEAEGHDIKSFKFLSCIVCVDDLKRLVESHELVESCGGLVEIKSQLKQGVFVGYEKPLVRQAIADVESCQ